MERNGTGWDAAPRPPKPQVAGALPLPPAQNPEFMGVKRTVAPAQCVYIAPRLAPPGATPQVSECGPVGEGFPGTAAGSSRLCPVISNLAASLVILGPNTGSGSPAIRRTLGEQRQSGGSLQSGYLRRNHVNAGPSTNGAASAASSSPVSTVPPKAMDGSGQNAGAPSSR